MRWTALAVLILTALAGGAFLALNRPGAEASPDVTVTVNRTADTITEDDGLLTLREAMMLATGDRRLDQLSYGECNQISGTLWGGAIGCISPDPPGAASADTIVFDADLFSPGFGAFIPLGDTLPILDSGDDTVDGSTAEVTIRGGGADISDFDCFEITSNGNTIKGLEIRECHVGVNIHSGAKHNTIGGGTQPERNVISGNYRGVFILGDGTEDNTVTGNFIGTDPSGTFAVANGLGVFIGSGAQGNKIGDSTAGQRNVISGNDANGVLISHGAAGNTVMGNYIGTDASGTSAIPNGQAGVVIRIDSQNNTVGGTAAGAGNVISGNGGSGVSITDSGTNDNVVKGNFIGTNASGTAAMGNGQYGVAIEDGPQNNTIGGIGSGEGNTIAFNQWHGVGVYDSGTTGNTIRGNSIHSNGDMGIRISEGGNEGLAYPTITGFGSVLGTACPNCIIDVYSDEEDEGKVYEGSTTADGAGNWTFAGSPEGPYVTATATDSDGNTSEFSDPVAVPEATPTPTPSPMPPVGPTRTLHWGPGWHNDIWTGASTPEEAFACAAGDYAAAYRFTDTGLERYFPDRPDISDMTPLAQYDAFLILITDDVTCEMPVVDPPDTERTLEWGVGWQNDGWTGPDGTAPEDAFACADGGYAAAYRFTDAGLERYFPDRPDISDMDPLAQHDAFLILVTAPVSCTMPIAP